MTALDPGAAAAIAEQLRPISIQALAGEELHRDDSGGHRTEHDTGQTGKPDGSAASPPRRPAATPNKVNAIGPGTRKPLRSQPQGLTGGVSSDVELRGPGLEPLPPSLGIWVYRADGRSGAFDPLPAVREAY
ncbi:MAG TPA: hypothetical protein VGL47_28170 [Amycolatopsis sp.]|uniref:hypothetical protein n=1 Tax=Amycolatopsis sp. TaxID=37632 RepID=UPI002F4202FA